MPSLPEISRRSTLVGLVTGLVGASQLVPEAKVIARDREFMSRDADPAKTLNAAMNGLARALEMNR